MTIERALVVVILVVLAPVIERARMADRWKAEAERFKADEIEARKQLSDAKRGKAALRERMARADLGEWVEAEPSEIYALVAADHVAHLRRNHI